MPARIFALFCAALFILAACTPAVTEAPEPTEPTALALPPEETAGQVQPTDAFMPTTDETARQLLYDLPRQRR
jgi:hypothetical protein